ncbi:MAG: AAA family ATPase [Pseudobdellovibrio sp.]
MAEKDLMSGKTKLTAKADKNIQTNTVTTAVSSSDTYSIGDLEPLKTDYRPVPYINSKLKTLKDFMNDPEVKLTSIVEKLIYEGTVNMFVGAPKGGKSTAIRDLIRAIVDGESFLGLKTTPCKILYIPLDEPPALLKENLLKLRIKNPENVLVTRLEETVDPFGDVEKICRETGIKLVVIDLMTKFTGIENLNDYSEGSEFTQKFRNLADRLNVAFILVHHSTKSDSKSALGSSAYEGSADNIAYFSRTKACGSFQTKGRFTEIPSTRIYLDPETNHLRVDKLQHLDLEECILLVLEDGTELSKTAIQNKVKRNKNDVLNAVDKLVEDGKVNMTTKGKFKLTIKKSV